MTGGEGFRERMKFREKCKLLWQLFMALVLGVVDRLSGLKIYMVLQEAYAKDMAAEQERMLERRMQEKR